MLRHYWVLALFLSLIVSNPGLDFHGSTLAFIAKKSTLLLSFFMLTAERSKAPKEVSLWTRQMRWPHWQADQVHGLRLRELGGGFARHSRAPTSQTACYVVLKPDILVDRIQIIKKLRGHRNAVYCGMPLALFSVVDKSPCQLCSQF
jgi:hypothetical protein